MNDRPSERTYCVLHYDAGTEVAVRLAEALGADRVPIPEGGTADAFSSRWKQGVVFVFVGALAIAVRAVAPLLSDKSRDAALVVVSEDGGVSLPVVSGHLGLATDAAKRCADILSGYGAQYVPTTASDRSGYVAPDLWAARRGYHVLLRSGLVSVIRRLADGAGIAVWADPILEKYGVTLPWPAGYRVVPNQADADLVVSPRSVQKLAGARPQIVPRVIAAGIGCRRGTPEDAIERCIKKALLESPEGPFLMEALCCLRTVEAKRGEPGLAALAARSALPLTVVPDDTILAQEGDFSPSAASRHIGLPGASEPAAASAGSLLGPRVTEDGAAVALSICPPAESGTLAVVGTGPGDARFLTDEARTAIRESDVLIGYGLYVDLLPGAWTRGKIVERYGMGEEEARVSRAIALAASGYRVALLSGGDASLFGLSSLALSLSAGSLRADRVRILPGITAAQAAGAAIGAPYSNGIALLSLSDYLQPWEDVVRSMEGAHDSGLAVAIYNPVRRGLAEKLAEVRRIFRDRRLILVRDAGRPDEEIRELPVANLHEDAIDMRTMLFFLSPKSREARFPAPPGSPGRAVWLETRGYGAEAGEDPATELGEFLVLGGTTEGRTVAESLLAQGHRVTVSVARDTGTATVPDGAVRLVGARDAAAWRKLFASAPPPFGVIDATHPFAVSATREMFAACREAGIPYCRYVRPDTAPPGAVRAADARDAAARAVALTEPGDTIFLAIGVNLLGSLLPDIREAGRRVLVRMLPTSDSMRRAERMGLEAREIVATWGAGDADFNEALCRSRNVRCIVSKDSGDAGGVCAKNEAAARLAIPFVLIERPPEPEGATLINAPQALLNWCNNIKKE